MGSVHFLPKSAYPLSPVLHQAFQESEIVVFEINLDKSGRIDGRNTSLQAGFYPKGRRLSREISPATLEILVPALSFFKLTLEEVDTMRPWFLSDLLMSRFLEIKGYRADLGVDRYFYRLAQQNRKEIAALETASEQMKPFRSLSDADADRYLRETLYSFAFVDPWLREMIRAWKKGDIATLEKFVIVDEPRESHFRRAVFDDRNEAWLPLIRKYLRGNKTVSVIAGSGHFLGTKGIVQRLQAEGYQVEQF